MNEVVLLKLVQFNQFVLQIHWLRKWCVVHTGLPLQEGGHFALAI